MSDELNNVIGGSIDIVLNIFAALLIIFPLQSFFNIFGEFHVLCD